MKKFFMLVTLTVFTLTTVLAQELMATPEVDNSENAMIRESIKLDSGATCLFENVKDASFSTENSYYTIDAQINKNPDQLTASLLAILLGSFGIQHFYIGQTTRGVLDILFCWTGVPAIIGLIEGIMWLCDDKDEWAQRVDDWNNN